MFPHPRSVIGTPEPAYRPRLNRVGVLLAHEVGVLDTPRYRSADPARVLSDARAAASYGISAGKTYEYSYMIGLDGIVFTQAGECVAAHCKNFNTLSAGVLFLNALDVPTNAAQVDAWWRLRDYMVAEHILSIAHVAAPHYRYRATSCPGLRAEAPGKAWQSPTGEGRLGNLIPALLVTPTPPIPPSEEDEMPPYIVRDTGLAGACFLPDGTPLSMATYLHLKDVRKVPVIEQDHAHWRETILHKMGPTARALYGR